MLADLPLLPTSVVGSHSLPSWLFLVREALQADRLGPTDIREAYDDAVRIAISDQVEAGLDVISDGEMRRVTFIRGFYERLTGIKPLPVPRRLGVPSYDSHCPYEVVDRIDAPEGLGIVDEFAFARSHAPRPLKIAVPGPLTLLMPLRRGGPYKSEENLVADLVAIVNRELTGLVAAGAEFLQVDEPNYVMGAGKHRIVKAGPAPMVEALNAAVGGVRAKLALHVCFGNAHNKAFAAPRRYRPLFPGILAARVDQFVFEYANREMAEIECWGEFPSEKEVAAGVIDVKAFRVETPEEVAERLRLALKYIAPERLWVVPDCGLWETPRWVGVAKLRAMVEGARIVRQELGAK
ncbi:MAG: cobalamin-independent methionine synthase II family protein [Candidatus Rokubacteria bacterium]|nr:cobalamin-independent methionine synthase II family protein [Candidatus Rokubacteria bacterium]